MMASALARGRSRTGLDTSPADAWSGTGNVDRWGWGLALIYICAVPVRVGHGLASLSPFDVALPVVVALEVVQRHRARTRLLRSTVLTWVIFTLVAWAALSGTWGASHTDWMRRMILLIEGIAAAWAVWSVVERRGAKPFILALGVSGTFSAATACLWFYALHADPAWTTQPPPDAAAAVSQALRLGSPLIGPSNYFATFLLVYIPATALLARRNAWWVVGVLLQLAALVSTVSRGALIALPLAAVLAVPLSWRLRDISAGRYAMGAATAALLTFVGPRLLTPLLNHRQLLPATQSAPVSPHSVVPSGSSRAPDANTSETLSAIVNPSGRGDLARQGLTLWREHPMRGVGFGNWRSNVPTANAAGAHDSLLQIAAELGSVGLLIVLAFLGVVFDRVRRIADPAMRWAGLTMILGVVINSFVEASIEGVAFFVFLGCVLGGLVGVGAKHWEIEEVGP